MLLPPTGLNDVQGSPRDVLGTAEAALERSAY